MGLLANKMKYAREGQEINSCKIFVYLRCAGPHLLYFESIFEKWSLYMYVSQRLSIQLNLIKVKNKKREKEPLKLINEKSQTQCFRKKLTPALFIISLCFFFLSFFYLRLQLSYTMNQNICYVSFATYYKDKIYNNDNNNNIKYFWSSQWSTKVSMRINAIM